MCCGRRFLCDHLQPAIGWKVPCVDELAARSMVLRLTCVSLAWLTLSRAKKADDAKYMVDHYSLIARVHVLDKEAASYMIKEAPKLSYFKPSYALRECFDYQSTRQGAEYWRDIASKLGDMTRYAPF